jgi:tetratricopeptide (TPR) repeat protein/TolB-like protein
MQAVKQEAKGSLFSGWKLYAGIAGLALVAVVIWALSGQENQDQPVRDPEAYAEQVKREISQSLAQAGIDLNSDFLQIPGVANRTNALAILGFENKTGDSTFDWLSAGLPEILLTDLSQGGAGNLISRNRVLDCLAGTNGSLVTDHTHEACVQAAASLGASKVLSGSFFKLGDKIRIDARLEDTKTGKIIVAEKVVGDDPFVLVDSLTGKLATSLDVISPEGGDVKVTRITSDSPEAYKQYILAMEQFELGRLDSSISLFEKAISIDSSFALPYMRIGMAYGMRGDTQRGASWFARAQERQDRLPTKLRLLLDAYTDIWLHRQFDDAMVKMEAYLDQYPDDKEVRAFYGILLHQLPQRTDAALAQLDTAAMIDESYYWVLTFYDMIYTQTGQVDKAIAVNDRLKHHYPGHPDAYLNMADLYRSQGRIDEAVSECRALLAREPENRSAHRRLLTYFILRGDIDAAEDQVRKLKDLGPDEPATLDDFHSRMANLQEWRGEFKSSLDHLHQALEASLETGDSLRVFSSYSALTRAHFSLGMPDSALHYSALGHDWAGIGQTFHHAMALVAVDPANEEKARPIFRKAANDFRSRVPEEMWSLVDNLELIFSAYQDSDTARLIEGIEWSVSNPLYASSRDRLELGELLVHSDRYAEAREVLLPLQEGPDRTTDGFTYLVSHYWSGRAEQALGNTQAAVEHFEEMLSWWDDPEIVTDKIKDARSRLNSLTS